ncbi:MAG: hypothetical protein J6J17_04490 [Bacilli bacterium]|nr:hypothetical protein [Bacilli bacterium]
MIQNTKMKSKSYYIKKDGIVEEVSKEEYDSNKSGPDSYLCSKCSVYSCNKIVTSDINLCPEVIDAYMCLIEKEILIDNKMEKVGVVDEFIVTKCTEYKMYKYLLRKQKRLQELEKLKSNSDLPKDKPIQSEEENTRNKEEAEYFRKLLLGFSEKGK